jgi:outer membrane lipoprotein-sorting protein
MKTKNNLQQQRGLAVIVDIILVALVLAVIAGIVYWVFQMRNNNAATVANTAVQSDCMKKYNDTPLCKAIANASALTNKPYTATANSNDPSQGNATFSIKSDGKGGSELTITQAGQPTTDIIELGGATYSKTADSNTWIKYSNNASGAPTETNPANSIKIDDSANSTESYKKIGTEACGSLTCYKYQVIDSANSTTDQFIWFDNKDYLIRRWSGKDSSGATVDMTFTYQAVSISTPSPVQDFSASISQ